jgi:hypothetical protein
MELRVCDPWLATYSGLSNYYAIIEAALDLSRLCAAPSACLTHFSFEGDRPIRCLKMRKESVYNSRGYSYLNLELGLR